MVDEGWIGEYGMDVREGKDDLRSCMDVNIIAFILFYSNSSSSSIVILVFLRLFLFLY